VQDVCCKSAFSSFVHLLLAVASSHE
jgi:hypothetical protein